jgi:hypothetical protein
LADDEAVCRNAPTQGRESTDLSAEWKVRHDAFDVVITGEDPVWDEVVPGCAAPGHGGFEERLPWVFSVEDGGRAVFRGHVLSDGMTLVAVDTAFPLLEVDRVGGQVSVHTGVAVAVEVEAFLADGGCCEHERPEG